MWCKGNESTKTVVDKIVESLMPLTSASNFFVDPIPTKTNFRKLTTNLLSDGGQSVMERQTLYLKIEHL